MCDQISINTESVDKYGHFIPCMEEERASAIETDWGKQIQVSCKHEQLQREQNNLCQMDKDFIDFIVAL